VFEHHRPRVSVQATKVKFVTEIPCQQCAFLNLNFDHLGSRAQISALDDRDLDDTDTTFFESRVFLEN